MKKIIASFLLFFLLGNSWAQGPSPIGKDANIVGYAGYFAKRQNTNNNGNWLGVYADLPLFKSTMGDVNLGLWTNYSHSYWTDNLAQYESKSQDFSLGLLTGYYGENFSYTHSFFGGLALGYKHSKETGVTDTKKYGSTGIQKDDLLVGTINLNLIKYSGFRMYLLPRTQLVFNFQTSLSSFKELSENEQKFRQVEAWDKASLDISLKQSIVDIALGYEYSTFLQPKVGIQYFHYTAGERDVFGTILEISLHHVYRDDFLSIIWMQKFHAKHDLGIFMVSLNLLKLKP